MPKQNRNPFNDEFIYDLYLSYHVSQKRLVEKIFNYLKSSLNLNVWLSNDDANFNENLNALQFTRLAFVCFPCKEYQNCIKNRIEYSIASEQQMKIINFTDIDDLKQII